MSSSKEQEYQRLFLQEASENFEELNKHLILLEKNNSDKKAINSIFRLVHTVKGNAMGLGFEAIANLSHVIEDVMGEVKEGHVALDESLFDSIFRAVDKLGQLLRAVESGKKVNYLGIKTKLEILLKNARENETEVEEKPQEGDKQASSPEEAETPEITFTDVIQIPVGKMDEMLNLVGQLIIEKDRLISRIGQNGSRSEFDSLQRITSDLQYSILNARMVPMEFMFNKFHRIVRDAALIEKKKVDLVLKGTDVEIDRNILKIISDSLIHVTRNAVSHGIEPPADRKKLGKEETGKVTLEALYEKDSVLIKVEDDGAGIDPDSLRRKVFEKGLMDREVALSLSDQDAILQIFQPGFSNAEKVTEISGRGVGMDVVKKSVESIGGQIDIKSEVGKGTAIHLLLPSSLALKAVLLMVIADQEYAIPLSFTEGVISVGKAEIHQIGRNFTIEYLEQTIPLIFLQDLLDAKSLEEGEGLISLNNAFQHLDESDKLDVIVVGYVGKLIGLAVDKLLHRQEVLEKPLQKPLDGVKLLSGTTILGNGNVCPVIDVAAISDLLFRQATSKKVTN